MRIPLITLVALAVLPIIPIAQTETFTGKLFTQIDLTVDGQAKAKTWVKVSPDGSQIAFPSQTFFTAIEGAYPKTISDAVKSRLNPGALLSNQLLKESGVLATFSREGKRLALTLISGITPTDGAPTKPTPEAAINIDQKPLGAEQDSVVKVVTAPEETVGQQKDTSDTVNANRRPINAEIITEDTVASDYEMNTVSYSKTREDLFRDYFKREPPPLPDSMEVELLIDEEAVNSFWIRFSKDRQTFSFPSEAVLPHLKPLLNPDVFHKIESGIGSDNRLKPAVLHQNGILTQLNQGRFEMSLTVPAQLLGKQIHLLSGQPPNLKNTESPSFLSAFINIRTRQRFTYLQNALIQTDTNKSRQLLNRARNDRTRQPNVTQLDGAVNLLDWVVEGVGYLQEKSELNSFEFLRKDFSLVHDFPKSSIRLVAGDLNYPTSGYQKLIRTGGVSVSREFGLNPHRLAYPTKDLEFFLEKPAQIQVFINGALVSTLQLNPGTHDLSGFPFALGESQVDIEITDITGKIEVIHFNFVHEPTLLAPGLSAFSFNAGYASLEDYKNGNFWGYYYDPSNPIYNAYYNIGINHALTLGVNTQNNLDQGVSGVSGILAIPKGKLSLDVAGSYGEKIPDAALKLGYSFSPKTGQNTSRWVWRNQIEYLGKNFRTLVNTNDSGNLYLNLASYFTVPFKAVSLNSSFGYGFYRYNDNTYFAQGGVNKGWRNGINATASLKTYFDRRGFSETTVSATIYYSLYRGSQGISANHRTDTHPKNDQFQGGDQRWDQFSSVQYDYNTSSPFPKNPRIHAEANFGATTNDYAIRSSLWQNFGQAELNFWRLEPATANQGFFNQNYADVILQSSLVFAGGHVGFSRPVGNAFVMVDGVKSHENATIEINPNSEGYDGVYKGWLPGVLPNLQIYQVSKLRLNPTDAPIGSSVSKTDYNLMPTYKSGFYIPIGSEVKAIAIGSLQSENKVPIPFQSFGIFSHSKNKLINITCFTNGTGNFQMVGLTPGRYEFRLGEGENQQVAEFIIPEKFEGFVQLGPIVLKRKTARINKIEAEDFSGMKKSTK